jgi:serine/threonine protein kinase
MKLEAGQLLGGKFRLTFPLGAGGMGCVWAADDMQLGREVAVKLLTGSRDPAMQKRFMREARTAAQLRSPHVAQVFDFGIDDAQPFIVMERLEGEDLEQRLGRGRLDAEAVATLIDGAGAALSEAHASGIVHRDIKPANLFFAKVGGREIVKVLDFGIATRRLNSGPLTAEGSIIGTPLYMSPEQSQGQPVDHRSDLWSLAVVAYEALTGEHPFAGNTDWESLAAIAKRPIKPPSELVGDLAPTVDEFFQKALRRTTAERFPTADRLATAFVGAVRGESVPDEDIATKDTVPSQFPPPEIVERAQSNTDVVAVGGERVTKPVSRASLAVVVVVLALAGVSWFGVSVSAGEAAQATTGLLPDRSVLIETAAVELANSTEPTEAAPVPSGQSKAKGSADAIDRPPPAQRPTTQPPGPAAGPTAPTRPKGGDANEFGI